MIFSLLVMCASTPLSVQHDALASEQWQSRDRALAWLVTNLRGEELGPSNMPNAIGKRSVAMAAALFAAQIRGCPEGVEPEDFQMAVDEWSQSVDARRSGAMSDTFSSWIEGANAICAAEWTEQCGAMHPALERAGRHFPHTQNSEGGWSHGARESVATFYPSTLIATTNLALIAMGCAQLAGVDTDSDAIEDALDLLETVQAPSGGFAYGGLNYKVGVEAGRTAGALVAIASTGRWDSPVGPGAVGYVRKNMDRIPEGHASPALHVFLGALASGILGPRDFDRYRVEVLTRVVAAQNEDGWYADIVPGSPDSLVMAGTIEMNRCYITALYAAGISAEESRLVARLSADCPYRRSEIPRAIDPEADVERGVVASFHDVIGYSVAALELHVLDSTGTLHRVRVSTGTVEREGPFSIPQGEVEQLHRLADGSLLVRYRSIDLNPTASLFGPSGQGEDPETTGSVVRPGQGQAARLVRVQPGSAGTEWMVELPASTFTMLIEGTAIWTHSKGGAACMIALEDGRVIESVSEGENPIRGGTCKVGDLLVRASGPSIFAERGNELVWKRRLRAPRGVSPPAHTAVAVVGDDIYTASTDGLVLRRRLSDGNFLDEFSCGTAVIRLIRANNTVLALTDCGRMTALRGAERVWEVDVTQGRETKHRIRVDVGESTLGISCAERTLDVDLATGKLLSDAQRSASGGWRRIGGEWFRIAAPDGELTVTR